MAAALTVDPEDRNRLAISWTVIGSVAVDSYALGPGRQHLRVLNVDRRLVRAAAERVDRWQAGRPIKSATDPVNSYFADVLSCPRRILQPNPGPREIAALDSLCNFR